MPLRMVFHDELAAVIGEWSGKRIVGNNPADPSWREAVWQHERVIETLMLHGATLPVRFGTILADEERVRTLLVERQTTFMADLAYLAGKVEMGLRVLWERPESEEGEPSSMMIKGRGGEGPGIRYLQQRAAELKREEVVQARGKRLAEQLNAALCSVTVDSHLQILQTKRLLLSAAYLVEQEAIETFRKEVETLRRSYPHLHFLVSGPWPAYNFVSKGPNR